MKAPGKKIDTIPSAVVEELGRYGWPGNVRELENVIQRAVITTPGTTLRLAASLTPRAKDAAAASDDGSLELADVEASHYFRPKTVRLAHRRSPRRRDCSRAPSEHTSLSHEETRCHPAHTYLPLAHSISWGHQIWWRSSCFVFGPSSLKCLFLSRLVDYSPSGKRRAMASHRVARKDMVTLRFLVRVSREKRHELVQSLSSFIPEEPARPYRRLLLQDLNDEDVVCWMGEFRERADLDRFLSSESCRALRGAAKVLGHLEEVQLVEISDCSAVTP